MVSVMSVGGSIIAPSSPDVEFINRFASFIKNYLSSDRERRIILTIGGGGVARSYINSYKEVMASLNDAPSLYDGDMIGIMATRLNAELVRSVFASLCPSPVVYDPTSIDAFEGQVLVAAGWKPGFSTDTDATILAEKFGAQMLLNLSNITKVYTADPKKYENAKPIDEIGWDAFLEMIGSEWQPGKNVPFDPIASKMAKKAGIKVVCANGKDIENIDNILNGRKFVGTVIG